MMIMNGGSGPKTGYIPDARKLQALQRFACKTVHNLNNILGAIEGYATLAGDDAAQAELLKKDLNEILAAVAQAAGLGKRLLAFGGKRLLHAAPCALDRLVEGTLQSTGTIAGPGQKIEARLGPGLPLVNIDAVLVQQALAELIMNALEVMPGGGTVVITVGVVRRTSSAANPPGLENAGEAFVKLSVRDTGPGITAEVLDRIFEPFYSTVKTGCDAGLGLSMVYSVVCQHNGWVEVDTAPGRGSEFSIYLPTASQAARRR